MRRHGYMIGIVAAALALSGLAGCVDEASLGIRGVVKHTGTESSEDVECPDGMGGVTTRQKPVLSCSKSVEPGSAENFLTRVSIDISDFEGDTGGQLAASGGQVISDEEFCMLDSSTYRERRYRRQAFVITLDTENRLKDSREVGSEGQGGGGGGYENLQLNTNDIHLQQLKVRFPDAPADSLEKTIELSLLAESGGGGAAVEFILFDGNDVSALQSVHQSLADSPEKAVTIIAEFTIEGETIGGNEITSNTFTFPLQICGQGCGTTPACDFQAESGGV